MVAPLAVEYRPAVQAVQGPGRPVPVKYVPAEQSWHVPAMVAPSAVLYSPWRQGWHVLARLAPAVALYVPAWHCTQMLATLAPAVRP